MPTIEDGRNAFDQRDLRQAEQIFRTILQENPHSEEASRELAYTLSIRLMGDPDIIKKKEDLLNGNLPNKYGEWFWHVIFKNKCEQLLAKEYSFLRSVDRNRLCTTIIDITILVLSAEDVKLQIENRLMTDPDIIKLKGDLERINEQVWTTTIRDKCEQLLAKGYPSISEVDRKRVAQLIVSGVPTPALSVEELGQQIQNRVMTDPEVCELRGDLERINEQVWTTTIRDKCEQLLSQEYNFLSLVDRTKLFNAVVRSIPTPALSSEELRQRIQDKLMADPDVNRFLRNLNKSVLDLDGVKLYEVRKIINDKYKQILAQENISFRSIMSQFNLFDTIMGDIPAPTLRRVFDGRHFVFIQADDHHHVTLRIDGARQTYRKPTILSRHLHTTDGSRRVTPPTLQWLSLTTDRKIYRSGDEAALFIVAPSAANQEIKLKIIRNAAMKGDLTVYEAMRGRGGKTVYEVGLPLNSNGLALHRYEDLREGEYSATITLPTQQKHNQVEDAITTFSVAEYTFSPLSATLVAHSYNEGHLNFTLKLHLFSRPYDGPAEFGYQFHSNRVLVRQTVEVRDGLAQGKLNLSGYAMLLSHVQVITPDGHTALISLPRPDYPYSQGRAVSINGLGQTTSISLLPRTEDDRQVRELFIQPGKINMTPLILESACASQGRLQATVEINQVQVVIFNPHTGGSRVIERTGLNVGDTIEFDVESPYTKFTVGAFLADPESEPFEGGGVVIKPVAFEANLVVPSTARPGQEINLDLQLASTHSESGQGMLKEKKPGAFCWLLVYDARLVHESPLPKLAQDIYSNIRQTTKNLTIGPVHSYLGQLMMSGGSLGEFRQYTYTLNASSMLATARADSREFQGRLIASPAAMSASIRLDFPAVVYQDLFYFEGQVSRTIKLGDQIGTWRVQAYIFQGADYRELTTEVHAQKPLYAELDLPAILSQGDQINAAVNYHTPKVADLVITTPLGENRHQVAGSGMTHFTLTKPGQVEARLKSLAGSDRTLGSVSPPGVQKVTVSRLMRLRQGETVQGESVVIYPSIAPVLKDTIAALLAYPFGCAEQTASTLFGLAIAYRGISQEVVEGDLQTTHARVEAGLHRLKTFQKGGLFSIWNGRQSEVDTTVRVVQRLLSLRGLPFPTAEEMLTWAKNMLLKHNYRDNGLLPLDMQFREEMTTPEDAVAYYFAAKDTTSFQKSAKVQAEALELLHQTAQHEEDKVQWPARSAWGGSLEVTADAARVMYDANDDLFEPAFSFVAGQLVNGMLYSTADTRALIELLAFLKFAPSARAVIDGQEVALNEVTMGQQVTALNDNLMVRINEETEINHLTPRANFQFMVEPSRTSLKVGDRMQIIVSPKEQTICPLARLFLPGNLALLKGGVNAQTAYLPIEHDELIVEAIAVRSGRAKLYVSVHDMYDAQKVGTIPGIEITVR